MAGIKKAISMPNAGAANPPSTVTEEDARPLQCSREADHRCTPAGDGAAGYDSHAGNRGETGRESLRPACSPKLPASVGVREGNSRDHEQGTTRSDGPLPPEAVDENPSRQARDEHEQWVGGEQQPDLGSGEVELTGEVREKRVDGNEERLVEKDHSRAEPEGAAHVIT